MPALLTASWKARLHPGTVIQGLIAGSFIHAASGAYGAKIAPLSDQEILSRAGIIPIHDIFEYRATTRIFTFTGDPSLRAVFDPCITGSPQENVSDGYWILLRSPSLGEHTIHAMGRTRDGGMYEFIMSLTVASAQP